MALQRRIILPLYDTLPNNMGSFFAKKGVV